MLDEINLPRSQSTSGGDVTHYYLVRPIQMRGKGGHCYLESIRDGGTELTRFSTWTSNKTKAMQFPLFEDAQAQRKLLPQSLGAVVRIKVA